MQTEQQTPNDQAPAGHIPTADAAPSPLLAHIPTERELAATLSASKEPAQKAEGEERAAAWSAWVADTKEHGVREPVKYTRDAAGKIWIVDGRNRHAAALEAGLETIPAVEVAEAEVAGLAISTLAHRKGQTKGGLAYLAITFHPALAHQGSGRKTEKRTDCAFPTLAALAAMLGVSARLVDEAAETFRFFAAHPSARKKLEGLVIAGVIGLGAARAGAASATATGGQARRPSNYASATRSIRSLGSQLRELDAWEEADRDAARTAFRHAFGTMPDAARALLLDCLTNPETDTTTTE